MTPELFETILLNEISGLGLAAVAYPKDPEHYYPENDPGEVLVRYEGRKPISRDTSGTFCMVKFFGEIVVVTREPRGTSGAYEWLQMVYNRLEGFTPEGCHGHFEMEVESFINEDKGLWQFGQKWGFVTPVAQNYTDDYHDGDLGAEG